MVPVIIAPMTLETPPRPTHTETQDLDALIKEARRRARRRKMLYALAALLVAGGIAAGVGTSLSGGHGPTSTGSAIPVIWGKASSSMKGTLTGVVSQPPPTRIVLFAAQPRSHSFRLLDNGPFKPGPWVDGDPIASPDGRTLAFARSPNFGHDPNEGSLFVLDRASGRTTRLADVGAAGVLQWTPDGRLIVYLSCLGHQGCDLRSIRPDGSGARLLSAGVRTSGRLAVSPDSRWVAFSTSVSRSRVGLFVERLHGSRQRILLARRSVIDVTSWSKQGWIAFGTRNTVEAVNLSSQVRTYTRGQSAVWSPNGSWLAFNGRGAWAVRSDGRNPHRLGLGVVGAWSPDSRRILLLGAKGRTTEMFVTRPTGGAPRLIASIPGLVRRGGTTTILAEARVSGWLRK